MVTRYVPNVGHARHENTFLVLSGSETTSERTKRL